MDLKLKKKKPFDEWKIKKNYEFHSIFIEDKVNVFWKKIKPMSSSLCYAHCT